MQKVIIISTLWCEPSSSAAGVHMQQLLQMFLEQGYSLTYASTANKSDFALETTDVNLKQIQLNCSSFDAWIKEENPDIVLFDRFTAEEQFGWRVRENCPNALTILNTEDLHSLRKSREEAIKTNSLWDIHFWKNQEITYREISSILKCDLNLMVSETEINFLITYFGVKEAQLMYLPICIDLNSLEPKKFEERAHFYTIGNFMHSPNLDSIQWVKSEIWPLIRKELPKAEFHIFGAYLTGKARALHAPKDGFFIKGKLGDLENVLPTYRVCLAPLRFGAGIKGKFLEAMKFGTPFSTSYIGTEDLQVAVKTYAKPEDIAIDAIKTYTDKDVWMQKQSLGFECIKNRYARLSYAENCLEKIQNIKRQLETHRNIHFMGELLKQQSNNSSKYFSKWLELKNKA